jgi:ATP-binding cassette, subfamily B, bacterial
VRDVGRCVRILIGTAWRAGPRKTLVAVGLMLVYALTSPLLAVALGWMTDEVVARRATEAAQAGVVVAALAIISLTFSNFAEIAYFELSELVELDLHQSLLEVSNGSPRIKHHEVPEQADEMTVLLQESRQFRYSLEALLNGASLLLAIVVGAVILASQNVLLLLLPAAALVPLVGGRLAESSMDRARTATAEPTRIALNLFRLTTSGRFAGELRVFGVGRELRQRHAQLWQAGSAVLWRAQLKAMWLRTAGQVVFALAYVGAVLLVIHDVIAGHRGVGDVVLVITLATQVTQQVTAAVTYLRELLRMASSYRRLGEFRAMVAEPVSPVSLGAPDQLRQGITLRGVGFGYPGSGQQALRDVDLTLPAGCTVAIVGENGAGKSTLVKLLCGLYQPSQGQILVDGKDLDQIPVEQWRQRIATGFQDFVRYEFSALQAIGVGDVPQVDDRPAVGAAMVRAHADTVLEALDDGLDTRLGKSYADGTELSGGQWQKLALARAFMRECPLLLILDEPTFALDPQAEHDLFHRYAEQAKVAARASGAITVLVTHRFSTVKMADLIIVIEDGHVSEAGEHADLAARGGTYAEMFSLQAEGYR